MIFAVLPFLVHLVFCSGEEKAAGHPSLRGKGGGESDLVKFPQHIHHEDRETAFVIEKGLGLKTLDVQRTSQSMKRRRMAECSLNAAGFYGTTIGDIYEVEYFYEVTTRGGNQDTITPVPVKVAQRLDYAIAEGAVELLFNCSLAASRFWAEQPLLVGGQFRGASAALGDEVVGDRSCSGDGAVTERNGPEKCFVMHGFMILMSQGFPNADTVNKVFQKAVQVTLQDTAFVESIHPDVVGAQYLNDELRPISSAKHQNSELITATSTVPPTGHTTVVITPINSPPRTVPPTRTTAIAPTEGPTVTLTPFPTRRHSPRSPAPSLTNARLHLSQNPSPTPDIREPGILRTKPPLLANYNNHPTTEGLGLSGLSGTPADKNPSRSSTKVQWWGWMLIGAAFMVLLQLTALVAVFPARFIRGTSLARSRLQKPRRPKEPNDGLYVVKEHLHSHTTELASTVTATKNNGHSQKTQVNQQELAPLAVRSRYTKEQTPTEIQWEPPSSNNFPLSANPSHIETKQNMGEQGLAIGTPRGVAGINACADLQRLEETIRNGNEMLLLGSQQLEQQQTAESDAGLYLREVEERNQYENEWENEYLAHHPDFYTHQEEMGALSISSRNSDMSVHKRPEKVAHNSPGYCEEAVAAVGIRNGSSTTGIAVSAYERFIAIRDKMSNAGNIRAESDVAADLKSVEEMQVYPFDILQGGSLSWHKRDGGYEWGQFCAVTP